MSFQIDIAMVNQYHANIQIKFQQRNARLKPFVRSESQNAEYDYYDRIGPTEAVEVTGRHQDTPLIGTDHDRRRVSLRDFDWADLIDKKDKIRMLADPTSAYVMNAVMAMNRKQDDVIIQAAFATAYSGKNGETAVTLPASQVIASNYVERGTAAASNLTIGKLRRARYLLDKAEAAAEDEADLAIGLDPSQIQGLLATTEITNSDYNVIKALVQGDIDTYMGFKFIKTNRLAVNANVRDCICWEKQGLLYAGNDELETDVSKRNDKRNSAQVYVQGHFNATRMWEEKVIKIQCDETA